MRAAAAAAIVFVVVGGGWGVYSRVERVQSGKVVVMPMRAPASGGFEGAGAIRTPATLPGPTIGEQGTPAGNKGTSHPSEKGSLAVGPGREQGSKSAKRPVAPKKGASQPVASQHAASQATPQTPAR